MSPPSSKIIGGEFFQPPTLLASLLPVGQQVLARGWMVQKTNPKGAKTVAKLTFKSPEQIKAGAKTTLDLLLAAGSKVYFDGTMRVEIANSGRVYSTSGTYVIAALLDRVGELQTQLDESNSALQRLYELELDKEAEKSLRFEDE